MSETMTETMMDANETPATALADATFPFPELDRRGDVREQSAETIQYAIGSCSLGLVLAARSAHGVSAVLLGEDREALRAELRGRFPAARLVEDEVGMEPLVAEVSGFMEAPESGFTRELDLRGTEFQRAVWRALRDIPAGHTTTYTEIARRIGRPEAVRAVAQACAANRLAVVVPCHRVVRSDGDISGYRWGVERKRELLDRESGRRG
jgi:AraC family transcriptional regulator of adaptative response/methylated-DNA-[protein]-cysteine methyltransferase